MMIKNKTYFYFSIILMVLVIVLNFPFPHGQSHLTDVSVLNISITTVDGIQYTGMAIFLLLVLGLYLLVKSLGKYRGRIILLAILVISFAPLIIVKSYQHTIATGIYAISYERDQSNCSFNMIDENILQGICQLPFKNYSSKDVQFTIEFYEQYIFDDDVRMLSLMNNDNPYKVNIEGKETKHVKIESNIDVSKLEHYTTNGSASHVNLIIKSGEKYRDL